MNPEIVRLSAAAMLAAAIFAVHSVALAETWTVTSYGDDPNDATTLRGALHNARDGDTIDLTGLSGAIVLTWGATQVLRELPVIYSVTINGPGPDNLAIDGGAFSRVFHIFTGADVAISGLTVRNGSVSGDTDLTSNGGGIRNSGTLALSDCAISGNFASNSGAGIYNLAGEVLTVTNCTFTGNQTSGLGGAITNWANGSVSVSKSAFSANQAWAGAAIWNFGDVLTSGDAINSATLEVTDSVFSANVATMPMEIQIGEPAGVAIINEGTATIANVTVSNNTFEHEQFYGAGIWNGGRLTMSNSTMSDNTGGLFNGGIFPNGGSHFILGTLSVSNSTFHGQQFFAAIDGFGIASVISTTVAGNPGGGLGVEGIGLVTLKNSILAQNSQNCAITQAAKITSQNHNISDDTTCAPYLEQPDDFAPHTDPGLDPNGLKDNGGTTKTIALAIGSVAVDAIPPADCDVLTDQRGVSRPQGINCDIGAVEATPDFYLSPIAAISTVVGSAASTNVQVNSFVGFDSAVTLATSISPAGIGTSFNPDPVTPPSYGSVSAKLTVSVGPAVTPATYNIGVNGTSGSLSHSTSVKVIVGVTSAGIAQVVGVDQAAGCIDNAGVTNAITSKLAQAQSDIDLGNIQDAKTILNDLLALLQAQRGKHIKTTCTINSVTFDPDVVLIADVQALLASL